MSDKLISELTPGTIVLLDGSVGAGKTELVKACAKILNLKGVQSPTFAFHNEYLDSKRNKFHHFDLYRLKSEDDLESIGLWDLLSHEADVFFIEWAKMLSADSWPIGRKLIQIQIDKNADEVSRRISWRLLE